MYVLNRINDEAGEEEEVNMYQVWGVCGGGNELERVWG